MKYLTTIKRRVKRLFNPYKPDMSEKINKKNLDIYIELVAEQKKISYEKAKKIMDNVKEEYDIGYQEYAQNRLYIYKTKKGLKKRIDRILNRRERNIQKVCTDTGWSYEKAKEEMIRVRRKFGISEWKYAGYRFFAFTDDEIRERLDKWSVSSRKYRSIVKENTGWATRDIRKHMIRYNVLYDISPAYYVLYKAWELTDQQMDSYARQKDSERVWAKYNDREAAKVLSDKLLFDQMYKDYIQRKFWVNVDTSFEEFKLFAEGLDSIFCKPVVSGGGIGTERYEIKGNLEELYDDLMSKPRILVEECVKQHNDIDEFLPGCINTIRVVVLMENKKCNVICTGIRFGYHGITDNFSQDGMVADVDKETGIILTPAIDKKGTVYETHPISGKKFVGFQIPRWSELLKVAIDAMDVQEEINFVGWDLAVREDSVVIIEGNTMPDLVLVQAPYAPIKQGKRYLFEPYF